MGGKKRIIRGKREEKEEKLKKRRKIKEYSAKKWNGKKKRWFCRKDFKSLFNRAWEGFQGPWNNIHPYSPLLEQTPARAGVQPPPQIEEKLKNKALDISHGIFFSVGVLDWGCGRSARWHARTNLTPSLYCVHIWLRARQKIKITVIENRLKKMLKFVFYTIVWKTKLSGVGFVRLDSGREPDMYTVQARSKICPCVPPRTRGRVRTNLQYARRKKM